MAVLGIVVMLTFVLSTGAVGSRNDFFDQLTAMFSSKGRGDVVAVAYGNDVHDADLTELRRQRQAANAYMQLAVDTAYLNWARDIERNDLTPSSTRLSPEAKRDIERFISLKINADKEIRPYQMYLQDFTRFGPESQRLGQAMQRAKAKPESEDKRVLDAVAAILVHDLTQPPVFMIGLGDSDRDLLDFYILLKKADQLGINFSEDGVMDLIKQDTLGRFSMEKDGVAVERRLRDNSRHGEFTSDWLIKAIGNEYRARATMSALEGQMPMAVMTRQRRDNSLPVLVLGIDGATLPLPGSLATASAMPGAVTPYEFYDFYKDKCSEHTFSLLELDAEKYLKDVQGEPTPKERVDLFNKHRGDLPDPSKDRPGFKEPRKVKVEFVTIDANAPRIAQAIPKVQAASLFLGVSAGIIAGDPVSALASASHPAIAESLPIKQAISEKMDTNLAPYRPSEQWFSFYMPRDVSVYRVQPIIGLLGGFSSYPSPTGAMTPIAIAFRHIEQHDLSVRIPFMLQGWLTPFNPTFGNALGMPAFAYALNPKLPPEGLYRGEIQKQVAKRQRQDLFKADVDELMTKLRKILEPAHPIFGKADKAKVESARKEAKQLIDTWVKDRGLNPTVTKSPVDQFEVLKDADLKPLNDLAKSELDGTNSLGKQLFEIIDPRTFNQPGAPFARTQPFSPFWFPDDPTGDQFDKPNHLVWISEEFEPKAYNSLDNANRLTNGDMTKRVDKAWKLEKARAIAKAEAEKIAEQMRGIAKAVAANPIGVNRQFLDLAAEKNGKLIELDRLALLKFQHEPTTAKMGYEPPKIEKNQVLYPTPDFADKLLELRKQPLGGVVVLEDSARTRYYVACEVSRAEKTVEQFRDVFAKTTATGAAQNPLYDRFVLPDERLRASKEVLERLRADAKLEEKEAFKNREKKDE